MHHDNPQLLKDQYWDDIVPQELPHTVASEQFKTEPPVSSTANVFVTEDEGEIISPPSLRSVNRANLSESPGTPSILRRSSIRSHRPRYSSTRSNQSEQSLAPPRKGSASGKFNLFKRLISRDHGSKLSVAENYEVGAGDVFGSTMNVDDAIPELDENLVTIVSTRKADEVRKPTVQEIFSHAEDPLSSSSTRSPTSFDAMTVSDGHNENEEELLLNDLSTSGKSEIQDKNENT